MPTIDRSGDLERKRTAFALILAAVAGSSDAIGFLLLVQIFIAHVTGDSVTSAVMLGRLDWIELAHSTFPVVAFVVGLTIGSVFMERATRRGVQANASAALAIEAALITAMMVYGALASHNASLPFRAGAPLYLLISLGAMAMGIQNTTLRDSSWRTVHTTYITGALTNAVEELVALLVRRPELTAGSPAERPDPSPDRLLLYGGIYCCYLVSALAGTILELGLHFWAFAAPVVGLIIAIAWNQVSSIYRARSDDPIRH